MTKILIGALVPVFAEIEGGGHDEIVTITLTRDVVQIHNPAMPARHGAQRPSNASEHFRIVRSGTTLPVTTAEARALIEMDAAVRRRPAEAAPMPTPEPAPEPLDEGGEGGEGAEDSSIGAEGGAQE